MLVYKIGDILKSTENIICHQVNEDGVMGGGLALQIATQYPHVEKEYKKFCNQFKDILYGQYQICKIEDRKYIANCFTQRNFITNLEDIEKVFKGLLESCKLNNFSICIPYKYGCGIANGNWEEVSKLFDSLSSEYNIDINVYKYEPRVSSFLNDEVEIIEEDKEIEYLHYHVGDRQLLYKGTTYPIRMVDIAMIEKIDELIDEIKKLKDNK